MLSTLAGLIELWDEFGPLLIPAAVMTVVTTYNAAVCLWSLLRWLAGLPAAFYRKWISYATELKIDLTKTYRTRDGRAVRNLTKREGMVLAYPLQGEVYAGEPAGWHCYCWTECGAFNKQSSLSPSDLVEVPAEEPKSEPVKGRSADRVVVDDPVRPEPPKCSVDVVMKRVIDEELANPAPLVPEPPKEPLLDLTKTYRTRHGLKVTDLKREVRKSGWNVKGRVHYGDGSTCPGCLWTDAGKWGRFDLTREPHDWDLIEVEETRARDDTPAHPPAAEAPAAAGKTRLSGRLVKIDAETGLLLDEPKQAPPAEVPPAVPAGERAERDAPGAEALPGHRLDLTRPLKTRDGRRVSDARLDPEASPGDAYQVKACIEGEGDNDFTLSGRYYSDDRTAEDSRDLVYADEPTPKLDWSKPLVTRDGRKATFAGAHPCLAFPFLASVENDPVTRTFDEGGFYWGSGEESVLDLFNAPETPKEETPVATPTPFDPGKPCRTRDGRPARVVSTKSGDKTYPLIAVIGMTDGSEDSETYTACGCARSDRVEHRNDLVNYEPDCPAAAPSEPEKASLLDLSRPLRWCDDGKPVKVVACGLPGPVQLLISYEPCDGTGGVVFDTLTADGKDASRVGIVENVPGSDPLPEAERPPSWSTLLCCYGWAKGDLPNNPLASPDKTPADDRGAEALKRIDALLDAVKSAEATGGYLKVSSSGYGKDSATFGFTWTTTVPQAQHERLVPPHQEAEAAQALKNVEHMKNWLAKGHSLVTVTDSGPWNGIGICCHKPEEYVKAHPTDEQKDALETVRQIKQMLGGKAAGNFDVVQDDIHRCGLNISPTRPPTAPRPDVSGAVHNINFIKQAMKDGRTVFLASPDDNCWNQIRLRSFTPEDYAKTTPLFAPPAGEGNAASLLAELKEAAERFGKIIVTKNIGVVGGLHWRRFGEIDSVTKEAADLKFAGRMMEFIREQFDLGRDVLRVHRDDGSPFGVNFFAENQPAPKPLPFDPTKPCRTRDGRVARVLSTGVKSQRPIVAVIEKPDCDDVTACFYADGRINSGTGADNPSDLVNDPPLAPKEHLFWIKVYSDGSSSFYRHGEKADRSGNPPPVALARVVIPEGRFDEEPPNTA
jgi:hypothetical protein